jgi:hypothetical protein
MRIAIGSAVLIAAAPGTISAAQQQDQRQSAPAANPRQKAERPICRTMSSSTGSRLDGGTRVCLTAEQWRQRRSAPAQARNDADSD